MENKQCLHDVVRHPKVNFAGGDDNENIRVTRSKKQSDEVTRTGAVALLALISSTPTEMQSLRHSSTPSGYRRKDQSWPPTAKVPEWRKRPTLRPRCRLYPVISKTCAACSVSGKNTDLSIYNPCIVYSGTDQMPRVLVNGTPCLAIRPQNAFLAEPRSASFQTMPGPVSTFNLSHINMAYNYNLN
jgi:hypothetical protein